MTDHRRNMRDTSPATEAEAEDFANRWGLYANEHVRNKHKKPGPNHEANDEIRWGDKALFQLSFPIAGAQSRSLEQFIQVLRPARVWSLNLALTLLSPNNAIAAGDTVQAIFRITLGVGASRIFMGRVLNQATFLNVPPLTTNVIIDAVPASQIIVGVDLTYTAAAAREVSIAIDAAASPVMR